MFKFLRSLLDLQNQFDRMTRRISELTRELRELDKKARGDIIDLKHAVRRLENALEERHIAESCQHEHPQTEERRPSAAAGCCDSPKHRRKDKAKG